MSLIKKNSSGGLLLSLISAALRHEIIERQCLLKLVAEGDVAHDVA